MSQGRTVDPLDSVDSRAVFVAVSKTPEFRELRSSFRRFAFPMTIAGLTSYFVYVVLSIYAVDFMASPFLGMVGLNTGIMLGLFQFVVVWVWTAIYVNYANRKLDPLAASIKAHIVNEGAA
jgi:uncharacterized membrane protein (DUF485 family)